MGCKQRNYVGHRWGWGWGWVLPKNHPGVRYFYSSGASQCAYIQKVTMAACRLDGFGERGEAFEISLEILLPYLSPFLTFLALKLILVFHISSGIEWGNLSCDDLPGNIRQRECDRPKACSDFAAHEMSSNLRLHLCQIVFLALLK